MTGMDRGRTMRRNIWASLHPSMQAASSTLGLIGEVQPSPVLSHEPVETVTLIPMGAARLRISAFPWIGEGPTAREWQGTPPSEARIAARESYCWEADTNAALSDGQVPTTSHDKTVNRFTWWPHKGTAEWVEYEFLQDRHVEMLPRAGAIERNRRVEVHVIAQ